MPNTLLALTHLPVFVPADTPNALKPDALQALSTGYAANLLVMLPIRRTLFSESRHPLLLISSSKQAVKAFSLCAEPLG